MLPGLDELPGMPDPFEILELGDGETRTMSPVSWELGKAMISPRDGRPGKIVRVLRLHVSPAEKPTLPDYWDVTSAHLVAGLLPYLEQMPGRRWRFTITKYGLNEKSRFTLAAEPVPA